MGGVDYKPTQAEFEASYPLDFGSGVRAHWYAYKGTEHAGLVVAHLHADGELCSGAVPIKGRDLDDFEGRRPTWTLVQEEPLTLTPSIHDPECGLHGFITNGKWNGA